MTVGPQGWKQSTATPIRVPRWIRLLLTLPGVGLMLAVVIALEVGSIARFATAEKLAAYAGTPRVSASGGKIRFGPSRPDVNRYLNHHHAHNGEGMAPTQRIDEADDDDRFKSTGPQMPPSAKRCRASRGGPRSYGACE